MTEKRVTDVSSRVFIREAGELLDRRPATIRMWEREHLLPKKLRPQRSDRGWRYWTYEQIEQIGNWMREKDMRPGKGLPHYDPDPEALHRHLEGQRRPRKHREDEAVAA